MNDIQDISSLAHPEDSRVALVSCKEDFIRAGQSKKFLAVIWENAVSQKRISNITDVLQSSWEFITLGAAPRRKDAFFLSTMNSFGLEENDEYQDFERIKDEMIEHYGEINGSKLLFTYVLGKGLCYPEHTDSTNYINISFGGLGTAWRNSEGKILYVGAGNILFFTKDFKHFSPSMGHLYGGKKGDELLISDEKPAFVLSGNSL